MNDMFFVNEANLDKRHIIFNCPEGKVLIDSFDGDVYNKHLIYLQNEFGGFEYKGYVMLPYAPYPWLCEKIYNECKEYLKK